MDAVQAIILRPPPTGATPEQWQAAIAIMRPAVAPATFWLIVNPPPRIKRPIPIPHFPAAAAYRLRNAR